VKPIVRHALALRAICEEELARTIMKFGERYIGIKLGMSIGRHSDLLTLVLLQKLHLFWTSIHAQGRFVITNHGT
jgi:hypothetical protein